MDEETFPLTSSRLKNTILVENINKRTTDYGSPSLDYGPADMEFESAKIPYLWIVLYSINALLNDLLTAYPSEQLTAWKVDNLRFDK